MERGICDATTRATGDHEQDLFRSRLDQIIDMKHALVKLARAIDWGFLEQTFGAVYTDKPGQPPLPPPGGGASDPQAHLRPFRRGSVRPLGGRRFGVKRFLVVRGVVGAVSGVACFCATSLEEIIGGVVAIISFRPGGWMQQSAVPRCAILSVGSTGGIG